MSPGPSVAVVINYAMSGNKWVGLCCAWGHGIAIALYAFISAFGLLIVFEKSLLVFNFLQLAGIAVLLTLGIKLFNAQTPLISISDRPLSQSYWRAARDGFLVAFVNPKVMLFFTALFSQFLYQGMSVTQKAWSGICCLLGRCSMVLYRCIFGYSNHNPRKVTPVFSYH